MPNEEQVSLKQLLEEIRDTRKEVKNCISATETRLLLEIQHLKNKNVALEEENNCLKEKLERTERWCRKNNIVIFGLRRESDLTADFLCRELNRLLNVCIDASQISDFYTLGKGENSPVKVEFCSYQNKKLIFEHVKSLKGTDVSVSNDLTVQQRQEINKLKAYLVKARANSTEKSFIRGNRLFVGQRTYTLEELEGPEEETKSNSAPNTPTITSNVIFEKDESNTNELKSESGLSNKLKNGGDKKFSTPHLSTHRKIFTNRKKSPTKDNLIGMKLRHKSTTDKNN